MKININNLTLECKYQYSICNNCLFTKGTKCVYEYPILYQLCTKCDIIFTKHSSPDLFNL